MVLIIRRNSTRDFSIFVSGTALSKKRGKAVRINAITYLSMIPLGSFAGTALNVNINQKSTLLKLKSCTYTVENRRNEKARAGSYSSRMLQKY